MRFFSYLLDKVAGKILSWQHLYLSPSAKLIMINSILVAMTSHVMGSFSLRTGILNKLDSLVISFWWSSNGRKGVH